MTPPEFVQWLPVSDAERQMKSPSVEKDAGAEVLFWRVHIIDELLGSNVDLQRMQYHYVRLKIFDDRGKEGATTIDLPFGDREAVLNVAGRTIKADGTIVELDRKTVFTRDLVRAGRRTRKAVSFAMPGVEPGAIVEYRWMQRADNESMVYVRLKFQREFPVAKVTYFVKPLPEPYNAGYEMYIVPFNCKTSPFKLEPDGYSSTYVENLPAIREEPYAPSEPNLTAWALLHYQLGDRKNATKYWTDLGRKSYQELKDSSKSNDEMKTAAIAATTGGKDNEVKAIALTTLIRKRIRNVFDDEVSEAERQKYVKDLPKDRRRTAVEVFRSGLGTADEMNVVFAAMAQQAGIEARPIAISNRGDFIFQPNLISDDFFLRNIDMAVKVGDTWKLFDVSTKLLPPGMISWREEGMFALLTDPKTPSFIRTPLSPPEASAEMRKAQLALNASGALEGDVQEAYSGHRAEDSRSELLKASAAQREEWLTNRVTRMFPDAEVTNIKFENIDDAGQDLKASYHLRAPRYAQVTGKRILMQTNPFRRSQASPFSAATRRHPVEFPYGWKEVDQYNIKLPAGWVVDSPDSPGSLKFGNPGSYDIKMALHKENGLEMTREFTFGSNGMLYFEAKDYPPVKQVFDQVQARDRHALSLKVAE